MRAWWPISIVLAICACRGLVGIGELTLDEDAGASTDASANEDRAAPPPLPNRLPDLNCPKQQGCRECCQNSAPDGGFEIALNVYRQGCICGADPCGPPCGGQDDICKGSPPGPLSNAMDCRKCIHDTMIDASTATCKESSRRCEGNANCEQIVRCLRSCQ